MTEGNNPTDRSKLGKAKRYILTDKNGIPLSIIITSASAHDIKAVIDIIANAVLNRPFESSFTKKKKRNLHYHLCLARAYNSKSIEQEIIKFGYVPRIPYKRKRGHLKKNTYQKRYFPSKNKRRVIEERTNSWHNRFRKLFSRYEKKAENYLSLVWCTNYHAVSLSIKR
jgi:transposase